MRGLDSRVCEESIGGSKPIFPAPIMIRFAVCSLLLL